MLSLNSATYFTISSADCEVFEDKIEAMKREYVIKQLKRKEKLELIKNSKCIKS